MKNICIVVSNVDRAIAFEWIVQGLKNKHRLIFILIGKKDTFLARYLKENGIETLEIGYRGKKDAPKAVLRIFFFLLRRKVHVIHTHLVEATLYALLPAWLLRIRKRIYTRHHSDYNYKYSPKGIKYDLFSNRLATDIIAISGQVKKLLMEKEHVPERKITLIHHGIDIGFFENPDPEKAKSVAAKYNPAGKHPVIGIIARQTHWKGIQYTIPAFAAVLKDYPGALLLLANASGDYEAEIDRLLQEYLTPADFVKIRYEYDTPSLYRMIDVLVHVPVDDVVEAFGQVYIEALAARVPCVFTLSGIAVDCIEDGRNALVVPYCNSEAIETAVKKLLADTSLRETIIRGGSALVHERFGIEQFLSNLETLYQG